MSGVAAYVFQILGARVLGEQAYAPVGVLWTLQYLVLTVGLLSTEAYVTAHPTVPRAVWAWVGVLTAALAGAAALFGEPLFGGTSAAWPAGAALVGLGFGLLTVARGRAAAAGRFRLYGGISGGESLLRLVLAAALLMVSQSPEALGMTLGAGAAACGLWAMARLRRAALPDGDLGTTGAVTPFLARTTLANGIAQTLLAGGPVLTAVLGAPAATTTTVFVTTTAARAPLVFAYSGLLARILPPLRADVAGPRRARTLATVGRMGLGGLVLVPLAAAAGAATGPPLVALAFGSALRPSAGFAALTAVAVVCAFAGLLLNQVLIALDRAQALALPWLAGLAVAAVLVWATGGDIALQAGWASAGGLLVADALLLVALGRQ